MQIIHAAESALRKRVVACLVIALVAAATWWPRMSGPIDLRFDAGAYYILGTSLARGDGYRMLSEPGEIPSSLHPPLVPVLVAAHQLVLHSSDPVVVGHALRLTMVLASIAYAVAVFVLLAGYIPRRYAAAAAVLTVLPPQYVYFSDALYAETLFALFTVLFFVLHRHRRSTACFLLSGLCAVLAYETRTAGVALLVAWVADSLLRREFKRAGIALVVALAPVLAWMGWIHAVESSPSYRQPAYAYQTAPYLYFNVSYARNLSLQDPWAPELGPLTRRGFVERLWSNAKIVPKSIGQAVSSWEAPFRVWGPLALLVFLGLLLQVKRRQLVMLLYVALSLAAVCSTPFQQQFVRYVMPLYPFFALALFQLLAWAAVEARSRWPRLPPFITSAPGWAVLALIAVQVLPALREMYRQKHEVVAYEHAGERVTYRLFYYSPVGPAFDEALDWLHSRAAPRDVIAAGDPQWVYLRTGRKAVLAPLEIDGKKALQLIDSVPVKYLFAPSTGGYQRFIAALIAENPDAWRRVWSSANGTIDVYERVAPRAPSERTDAAPALGARAGGS